MGNLIIKALLAIVTKLITEKLLSKIVVYCLDYLAKRTTNKLDDKIVASVAEALGVELEKK